jgi:myosin heavy subunit
LSSAEPFLSSLCPEFGKSFTIQNFKYLQPSEDCEAVADADANIDAAKDKECWDETRRALATFGYEGDALLELMRALTILLQLGNLEFKSTTKLTDRTFTEHNTHITSSLNSASMPWELSKRSNTLELSTIEKS